MTTIAKTRSGVSHHKAIFIIKNFNGNSEGAAAFLCSQLSFCSFVKSQDAPALIGEMDSSGSLNAHALLHLTERVRARTVFQV